jgi:hypothetical protein
MMLSDSFRFGHLNFDHSNLFRISKFGFRALKKMTEP